MAMAEYGYGYRSVAEEYSGNPSRVYGGGKKESFTRGELWGWARVIVSAGLFFALVAAKVGMPQEFEQLRSAFEKNMGQSVDYRAVFSSVGRAASGEEPVGKTVSDVYAEVFHPNASVQQTSGLIASVDAETKTVSTVRSAVEEMKKTSDALSAALTAKKEEGNGAASEDGADNPAAVQEGANNAAAPQEMVYRPEDLPDDVCMDQKVLDLSYATPVKGWLSSSFGLREHPIDGEQKFHRGVDIAASEGSTITAFSDGKVKAVGESSSLGKYIMVSHKGDLTSLYAHCSRITVSSGASVKKGDKIAEVGHTGLANGSHLHFSLLQGETYINPIYYVSLEEAP